MVGDFHVTSFRGEEVPFVGYSCYFDEFSSLESVMLVVTNCLADLANHTFSRYFECFASVSYLLEGGEGSYSQTQG